MFFSKGMNIDSRDSDIAMFCTLEWLGSLSESCLCSFPVTFTQAFWMLFVNPTNFSISAGFRPPFGTKIFLCFYAFQSHTSEAIEIEAVKIDFCESRTYGLSGDSVSLDELTGIDLKKRVKIACDLERLSTGDRVPENIDSLSKKNTKISCDMRTIIMRDGVPENTRSDYRGNSVLWGSPTCINQKDNTNISFHFRTQSVRDRVSESTCSDVKKKVKILFDWRMVSAGIQLQRRKELIFQEIMCWLMILKEVI